MHRLNHSIFFKKIKLNLLPTNQFECKWKKRSSSLSTHPYREEMFQKWRKNPRLVDRTWDEFFNYDIYQPTSKKGFNYNIEAAVDKTSLVTDSQKLLLLIRAYQVRGHVKAKLDPLGLWKPPIPPDLKLETYGFTEEDLDREFYIGTNIISGFLSADRPKISLRDILKRLEETYCGSIGIEYMHIQDRAKCNWIRERLETKTKWTFTKEEKKRLLDRLIWAHAFEDFLDIKFNSSKRFSLEGCESLIPGLKALIDTACDLGVEKVVMGMPHRGRLNVLANVVRKPLGAIFAEFQGFALHFCLIYDYKGIIMKKILMLDILDQVKNLKKI